MGFFRGALRCGGISCGTNKGAFDSFSFFRVIEGMTLFSKFCNYSPIVFK